MGQEPRIIDPLQTSVDVAAEGGVNAFTVAAGTPVDDSVSTHVCERGIVSKWRQTDAGSSSVDGIVCIKMRSLGT